MTDRTYMEGLTAEQAKALEARIREAILATQEKCAQVAHEHECELPMCDCSRRVEAAIRALKMETGHAGT